MKIGDLVRAKPQAWRILHEFEDDWIGIITSFRIGDIHQPGPDCRYALVFWSEQYSQEEEYLDQLEVISESRSSSKIGIRSSAAGDYC